MNSDTTTTTVSTTEGTVVAHVDDPAKPGSTVDVPVTAGNTQTQLKNAAPAPAQKAPEPQRKVTVTVGASNTLVVDPLGRSNGVTKDGKLVIQTPGAQVKRDGSKIVVTLPDLPDGKLATRVEKKHDSDDGDVEVSATIKENGRRVDVSDAARSDGGRKTAGLEIGRDASGKTQGRTLADDEKQVLPRAKTARPTATGDASATLTPTERNDQRSNSPRPSATARASATTRPTETARPTATPRGSGTARPSGRPGDPQPSDERARDRPKEAQDSTKSVDRPAPSGFIPVTKGLPALPVPARSPGSKPSG